MTQYHSHNDLPSNTKAVSINILNARLADAIDLALHQASALEHKGSELHRAARDD